MSAQGTGDDTVHCGLCGGHTSVAMMVEHFVREHGFDREELAEAIATAPIIDRTDAAAEVIRVARIFIEVTDPSKFDEKERYVFDVLRDRLDNLEEP